MHHPHRPVRITPARRWQPLADAEWEALLPFVIVRDRPGRPLRDARRRMDALFWTAAAGSAWRAAPPRFGKADTLSRHFRRLTHAGLWERLLRALARPDCPPALLAVEHWIVSACRRAARLRGLGLLVLAKRLGLFSALRAPPHLLPKPDLSELVDRWLRRAAEDAGDHGPDAETLDFLRLCHRLGRFAAGRKRLGRRFLPI
jgi:transposase